MTLKNSGVPVFELRKTVQNADILLKHLHHVTLAEKLTLATWIMETVLKKSLQADFGAKLDNTMTRLTDVVKSMAALESKVT